MISLDLLLDTLESAANAAARPTTPVSVEAGELLRVVGEVARLKEQLADYESALAEQNLSAGPDYVRTLGRCYTIARESESKLKEQLAAKERECGELRRLCGGTRPVSLDKDQIAPTPKGD